MPPEITRTTPIGELVVNYPSAVEVLYNHGFHCIGCGLSAYETLEEGARVHGYSDKDIDEMVLELRDAAKGDIERIACLEKEIAAKKAEMAKKPAPVLKAADKEPKPEPEEKSGKAEKKKTLETKKVKKKSESG